MTYNEFISDILSTRGRHGIPKCTYKETHHIKPKCWGGSDEDENLIDLYAREHFIAHKLLAEENPDNYEIVYAFWCISIMSHGNEHYWLTPEEYEEVKTLYSSVHSKRMTGEGNPMYGVDVWKTYTPERASEIAAKISDANRGRKFTTEHRKHLSENNAMHKQEYRQKVSDSLKGHTVSEETRKKISDTKKKNPKVYTEEDRKKQSEIMKDTFSKMSLEERKLKFGKPKRVGKQPRLKWLTSEGEIKYMDKVNAHRYHKDWIEIKEE